MDADLYTAGSGLAWAVYGFDLAAVHPANVYVNLSGSIAPVTSISDNQLRCVLPPGVGRNHKAVVYVGGRPSNVLDVSYGAPVVTGFQFQVPPLSRRMGLG